jgi:nitroimidazol reductase NimA-like FMN-containing flavoprotein (pyridoxamine 5'-phosphate oxidase superfamily)
MPREIPVSDGFPPSERTRVRRLPERGLYERNEIYPVIDAALTCTVAYLLDGRPMATPTAHWRDGDHLYWHGSAASRFLKRVVGTEVCVSIHLNYRSATLFGICEEITGAEKVAQLDVFVEKLVPGRSKELRASHDKELKATTMLGMKISEASGKIRDGGVDDNEEDAGEKIWAGVLELESRFTKLIPDSDTPVIAMPSQALEQMIGKKI